MSNGYGYYWPNSPPWDGSTYWPQYPLPNGGNSVSSSSSSNSSKGGGINKTSIVTPSVVAIVALLGSAFLLVSYYRVFVKYCTAWQVFWGLRQPIEFTDRQQHRDITEYDEAWTVLNSGLDEALVKKIPIYVFKAGEGVIDSTDCAVCLGEFAREDELRLLPKCSHAFHVACIDTWLRSHSTCPLCRAPIISLRPPPQAFMMPPSNNNHRPHSLGDIMLTEEEQLATNTAIAVAVTATDVGVDQTAVSSSQTPEFDAAAAATLLRRSLSTQHIRCHDSFVLRRSYSAGSFLESRSIPPPTAATSDKNEENEFEVVDIEMGLKAGPSSSREEEDDRRKVISRSKSSKFGERGVSLNAAADGILRKSRSLKASLMRSFSFRNIPSARARSGPGHHEEQLL